MSASILDPTSSLETLQRDADRERPLARVSFVEGMLLGVEATRAEQDYHRRRLNRHLYWHHGAGTLAGMGVELLTSDLEAAQAQPDQLGVVTRLLVYPGYGVDGLGREIIVPERYVIDLDAWLRRVTDAALLAAALAPESAGRQTLFLYVMARCEPTGLDLTPVFARELNAGTDAVSFGRVADDLLLDLLPDGARGAEDASWAAGAAPWLHALADLWPSASATAPPGMSDDEAGRRRRLLQAFSGQDKLPRAPEDASIPALALLANVPLASVRIELDVQAGSPVLRTNATRIAINNLVRPFVRDATAALGAF